MVKIFIAGANGFIGYPVAQALSRAGHQVYGLTRSKEVAKKFQAEEIIPVLGEATSPHVWIDQVKDADVVIDTVGGNEIAKVCTILYEAFYEQAKKLRPDGPPLTYIYTSGVWVYGGDPKALYTDSGPLGSGIPLTSWRIPHEKRVTTTKTSFIQGIVVRPSILYGRSGSLIGDFLFKPASEGKLQWYGAAGGRVGTIHQDDLGDIYVKIIEKAPIFGGLSFLATNPESESWDFIISELGKHLGLKDVTYIPVGKNPLFEALALHQRFGVSSVRDLLGWTPRKRSLGDGLADYYAAWKATQ